MKFSVICASFGIRYKDYCSNLARTVMVAPTKSQLDAYNIAYDLEELVIKKLEPGVKLSDVYSAGIRWLKAKKPEFVDNLKKSFGSVDGQMDNFSFF
jgi:nucleosome binding factor SPN SPT16 subunit